MKVKLQLIKTVEENGRIAILAIPKEALNSLGWKGDEQVTLDIPMTGGGLVIHKETV